jgi:hypothetical protein
MIWIGDAKALTAMLLLKYHFRGDTETVTACAAINVVHRRKCKNEG